MGEVGKGEELGFELLLHHLEAGLDLLPLRGHRAHLRQHRIPLRGATIPSEGGDPLRGLVLLSAEVIRSLGEGAPLLIEGEERGEVERGIAAAEPSKDPLGIAADET